MTPVYRGCFAKGTRNGASALLRVHEECIAAIGLHDIAVGHGGLVPACSPDLRIVGTAWDDHSAEAFAPRGSCAESLRVMRVSGIGRNVNEERRDPRIGGPPSGTRLPPGAERTSRHSAPRDGRTLE